jgi:hypothetical protein
MPTGGESLVRYEILFRHVGDVGRVVGFSEDVVVGLVLARPDLDGNREPPLLGMVEEGVDVEDHPAKRTKAMDHHFTDPKFRFSHCLATFVLAIAQRPAKLQHRNPNIADPRHAAFPFGSNAEFR